MKIIAILIVLCACALVIAAGCTGQQPAPQTTVPTTSTTPTPITTAPVTPVTTATTVAVPANLAGSWTLTLMATQNGTVPTSPRAATITLTILPDGTLNGNGGCNNYNAAITLSGETTPKGSAIAVSPVVSTKMFCNQLAAQETSYFTILQRAMAYEVNVAKLTITASDGNVLVFQRSG